MTVIHTTHTFWNKQGKAPGVNTMLIQHVVIGFEVGRGDIERAGLVIT